MLPECSRIYYSEQSAQMIVENYVSSNVRLIESRIIHDI